MPLNIKDPATEKAVRELAACTGETVTTAVHRAAEERLQRVRSHRTGRSLAAEILEIGERCASLPDLLFLGDDFAQTDIERVAVT